MKKYIFILLASLSVMSCTPNNDNPLIQCLQDGVHADCNAENIDTAFPTETELQDTEYVQFEWQGETKTLPIMAHIEYSTGENRLTNCGPIDVNTQHIIGQFSESAADLFSDTADSHEIAPLSGNDFGWRWGYSYSTLNQFQLVPSLHIIPNENLIYVVLIGKPTFNYQVTPIVGQYEFYSISIQGI